MPHSDQMRFSSFSGAPHRAVRRLPWSGRLFLPFGENAFRVLEARLADLGNGALTGFGDKINRKTVGIQPAVHHLGFFFHRCAVADAECFQNCVVMFVECRGLLFGRGNIADSAFLPGESYLFQVVDAGTSLRNTVFHQVFQKIRGKVEIIIEKHDAFDFRRRQKMTEIRLRNVKNVLQFFAAAGSVFFFY